MLVFLFLLPWQTRWIYDPAFLNGDYWEYGTASFYGTEILLWLIVILFSVYYFRKREFWQAILNKERFAKQKWSVYAGVAAVVFCLVAIGASPQPGVSHNHFLWILAGLCLGQVIIIFWDTEKNWQQALAAVWSGAVVQAMFAIWQFVSQYVPANKWLGLATHYPWQLGASVVETSSERYLRAYGSLGGPNPLGIYLGVALLLGLLLYLKINKWRYKIPLTVGQVIIVVGLAFTFSRGAWLATFVGLVAFVVVAFSVRFNRAQWYDLARQLFFYFVTAIVIGLVLGPLMITRFSASTRLEEKSLSERTSQIGDAIEIFVAHPWFGVGEGVYTYDLFLRHPDQVGGSYQPVHNIYLLILAEWGIVGTALFLSLCVWLGKKLARNNLLYMPIILTLALSGLFDHWLWSLFPGVVFWWVIWALGLIRRSYDK